MDSTLVNMIEEFERDFPGWGWLVRNDRENGNYFVNLTSPNFKGKVIREPVTGKVHSSYSGRRFCALKPTAVQAFEAALVQLHEERDLYMSTTAPKTPYRFPWDL